MGAELKTVVPPSQAQTQDLKHLGFVQNYSDFAVKKGYGIATAVYSHAKPYVPKAQLLEDTAATQYQKLAPLLTKVQDYGQGALYNLDGKVDGVTSFVSSNQKYLASQQKSFHDKNLSYFKSAKDAYLAKVESAVESLKTKGVKATAGDGINYAKQQVLKLVDEAKQVPPYFQKEAKALLDKVADAYNHLYELPAVKKVLHSADPAIRTAKAQYLAAHDKIVTLPIYNKAVHTSQMVLDKAQHTYLYKTAANKLYPIVAKYADPLLEKSQPYVNAAVTHLTKPVANKPITTKPMADQPILKPVANQPITY